MGTDKQARPPKAKRYRPGDEPSAQDYQKAAALEELLVSSAGHQHILAAACTSEMRESAV